MDYIQTFSLKNSLSTLKAKTVCAKLVMAGLMGKGLRVGVRESQWKYEDLRGVALWIRKRVA